MRKLKRPEKTSEKLERVSQLGRLNFKPAAGQVSETNISVVSANVNDAGKMSKEVETMSKNIE